MDCPALELEKEHAGADGRREIFFRSSSLLQMQQDDETPPSRRRLVGGQSWVKLPLQRTFNPLFGRRSDS